MQFGQKQLFQIARDYPWYLFTGEEISELCNVGEDQVRRVRNAPDSPFRYNKCRPEWFTEWMQLHPETERFQALPRLRLTLCKRCVDGKRTQHLTKPLRAKKSTSTIRGAKRPLGGKS